jgi:hypothetical protein
VVHGLDGDDVICGQGGSDNIRGGPGHDVIDAGAGDDTARGGPGNDEIYGGAGDDLLINGGTGDDKVYGDGGNDSVIGGPGDDIIDGGSGDDGGLPGQGIVLLGQSGVDTIDGGPGADNIRGGAGPDDLAGGEGDDTIIGGAGADEIWGGDGNDTIAGSNGPDTIHGNEGADFIEGLAEADVLYGDEGNDTLAGGTFDDVVYGGEGDDGLAGGGGDDILDGGPGFDDLDGGAGTDTCTTGESLADCEPPDGEWEQYTEEELSYFFEIALGSEYGSGPLVVTRWEQDVRIAVTGTPTSSDMAELDSVIAEVNSAVDIDVGLDATAPNMTVHYTATADFSSICSLYVPGNIGFFCFWWNTAFEIVRAEVMIGTDTTQQERLHLAWEEVIQPLGLANDSYRYPDSIFYQGYTLTHGLSDIDRRILTLLYDPRIEPGMSESEVRAAVAGAPAETGSDRPRHVAAGHGSGGSEASPTDRL